MTSRPHATADVIVLNTSGSATRDAVMRPLMPVNLHEFDRRTFQRHESTLRQRAAPDRQTGFHPIHPQRTPPNRVRAFSAKTSTALSP
jgi:hypothetical protein